MEERFKEEKKGAIILLDIDNFKNINDTKGHIYGDRVLKNIGSKIKERICYNNTVYRFGGDEFLVHIEGKSKVEARWKKNKDHSHKYISRTNKRPPPYRLFKGENQGLQY